MRQYTGIDKLIHSFDQALRSLVPGQHPHKESIRPRKQKRISLSVKHVMLQA